MFEDTMEQFWGFLYWYSEKKVRLHWLMKNKSDLKCPNCGMWASINWHNKKPVDITTEGIIMTYICGQCKHITYWNTDIAPVAVRCDKKGYPVIK